MPSPIRCLAVKRITSQSRTDYGPCSYNCFLSLTVVVDRKIETDYTIVLRVIHSVQQRKIHHDRPGEYISTNRHITRATVSLSPLPSNHIRATISYLIASCTFTVYTQELGSWCNATARGGFGTVRCHFRYDLDEQKLDFTLQHRRLNSSFLSAVLSCNWDSDAMLPCFLRQGYTFNKTVSDQLEVNIPNATSADNDGMYVCQVVQNSNGDIFQPCELNLAGIPDPPSSIQVLNTTLESITMCWKAPPDKGEQVSYRIRYKPAMPDTDYKEVDVYPTGATCFSVTGLIPGTGYNISILALNKYGLSEYLAVAKIVNTSAKPNSRKEDISTTHDIFFVLTFVSFGLFILSFLILVILICRNFKGRWKTTFCWIAFPHCINRKRDDGRGSGTSADIFMEECPKNTRKADATVSSSTTSGSSRGCADHNIFPTVMGSRGWNPTVMGSRGWNPTVMEESPAVALDERPWERTIKSYEQKVNTAI